MTTATAGTHLFLGNGGLTNVWRQGRCFHTSTVLGATPNSNGSEKIVTVTMTRALYFTSGIHKSSAAGHEEETGAGSHETVGEEGSGFVYTFLAPKS